MITRSLNPKYKTGLVTIDGKLELEFLENGQINFNFKKVSNTDFETLVTISMNDLKDISDDAYEWLINLRYNILYGKLEL